MGSESILISSRQIWGTETRTANSLAAIRWACRGDGGLVMDALYTGEGDWLPPSLRKEAGRESEPFDVVAAVTAPPSPDLFRSLEDQGVTSVVSYPLAYTVGPGASLDQKRAALEQYGNDIIARLR